MYRDEILNKILFFWSFGEGAQAPPPVPHKYTPDKAFVLDEWILIIYLPFSI